MYNGITVPLLWQQNWTE